MIYNTSNLTSANHIGETAIAMHQLTGGYLFPLMIVFISLAIFGALKSRGHDTVDTMTLTGFGMTIMSFLLFQMGSMPFFFVMSFSILMVAGIFLKITRDRGI